MTKPTSIDRYVGSRLRLLRMMRGLSQEELAARLGLSSETIDRCEHGEERIPSDSLFVLANALEIPVGSFFKELQEGDEARAMVDGPEDRETAREALELLRAFSRISDTWERQTVLWLAQSYAKEQ